MSEPSRTTVHGGEWERGLWAMVFASAAVHVTLIVGAFLLPWSLTRSRPAPVSYTVDLVAPDKLGGTNMVPGKGKPGARPAAAVLPKPKPQPPPEKPKPAARKEAPKPKVEAKPAPRPQAKKPAPPAAPEKKAAAKPEAKAKPAPQAKPRPEAPAVAAARKPAKPGKPAPRKAPEDAKKETARGGAGDAPSDLDERIAAAIRRVERRVGTDTPDAMPGTGDGGGPLAVGPGTGVGGIVKGVEWLVYKNRVERQIKDNWHWAGNRQLEVEVHFGITETGELVDIRVAQSSGDRGFDVSAERAVRAANPVLPPPEAYKEDFLDFRLLFSGAESLEP